MGHPITDTSLYMRPAEVIKMFAVSRRTLSNWQKEKVIPFYKIKKLVLFKRSDIEEALERFRINAAQ